MVEVVWRAIIDINQMLSKQAVVALERDVNHAIGRNVKSLESAAVYFYLDTAVQFAP